jgi:hypothetical protein
MKRLLAAWGLLVITGATVTFASAQTQAAASTTSTTSKVSSQTAKVTFRRVFQGSSPEYIELCIWDDAKTATYEIRQMEDDPGSAPFEVGEPLRAKIFGLTAQLHNFQGLDLDVHRKIANLGEKTFRWEQAGVSHETKFNYTLNSAASQLLQIFEGLARQQEHYELITRRMKYDRLGIYDALLQFESDLNRGLLPEPQRLVPLLEQIANDPKFVDVARKRSQAIIARIQK